MSRATKKFGLALLVLATLAAGFHAAVTFAVDSIVKVRVEFGGEYDENQALKTLRGEAGPQFEPAVAATFDEPDRPAPFREVDVLDEAAKDWSSFFDGYSNAGVLVFDANGDDRPDLYLTHNNATWVRPTDGNAVLQDEPKIFGNGLYLNFGNEADGTPIFRRVDEIETGNATYEREEILVENYLYPRSSPSEPRGGRIGRASSTAIAADLDADGDLDLLVGNILPGMLWSHPKTQRVLGQFVRPVGRQAVSSKTPMTAQGLYFLKDYQPDDQRDDLRTSARGNDREAFGANSVFINEGDADGDGLPEWRDASRELGLEGNRNTMALLAMDFDLDGDLDVFEANIMDMDFWPGGATALAGAANQLYVNQLAETGTLTFEERSAELDVDGLYDDKDPVPEYRRLWRAPLLPEVYSVAMLRWESYRPEFLEIDGEQSEPGQISWASMVQDVNDDGYPDIWVANDIGYLRLYLNKDGKRFERSMDHPRSELSGYWMSLSAADFNGDGHEDLFAGNMGGASMNLAMPIPDMYSMFDPVMSSSTMTQQFFGGTHNSMHALLDGSTGFADYLEHKVKHSEVLPPDASLANNVRDFVVVDSEQVPFDRDGIDPYEFTWGSTVIDVQNDGRPDLYWVGCLQGRGGGIFPIMGTGPGRLLVNATGDSGDLRWVDLTAEYRVFNIQELQYDRLESEGYIYRRSPLQNWGKRSMVNSYDVSVWGFQGPGIVERITNHDMIQTAENGRAAAAADLNGDGFADLIVRNTGGYDSRASTSKNLKAEVDGRAQVIPAHDPNFPSPTNYEPGSTRVFLNSHAGASDAAHWIEIRPVDDRPGALNPFAVGAKVVVSGTVNGRQLQVVRAGNGGFVSNVFGPLLFGLGSGTAAEVEIRWPDKERTVTRVSLDGLYGGLLTVTASGKTEWQPRGVVLDPAAAGPVEADLAEAGAAGDAGDPGDAG